MQYQGETRFRSRNSLSGGGAGGSAPGGGTPKREKEKKQPNLVMPIAIGLFVVGMLVSVVYKAGRGSRGSCSYESVYRKVTCKGKQLNKLPHDINEAALAVHMGSKLDKAENFFIKLTPENFTKFVHLQELRLIKCGIEEIAPRTFETLPQLERLDLRYNRIQVITEETFQGMDALEYLYLSNNPIQRLGDNLFRGLSIDNLVLANNPALEDISGKVFVGATIKAVVLNRCNLSQIKSNTLSPLVGSLKEVYLTHNMRPLDLPDGLFTGLKLKTLSLVNNGLDDLDFLDDVSAEEIHLDDNPIPELDCDNCPGLSVTRVLTITKARITQIDADNLSSLSHLEELDLDGNDLTEFNATAFEDLDDLDILDLSNNEIEDFEGNFSVVLEDLDSLFLDGNEIQTLPADMEVLFSRLQNLTLHDNPLHCNCELRWLAKWLEGDAARRILRQLDEVSCATPEAVNFTLVSDYGFQCRAPAIFNATMDTDGISLVCVADGDPAPRITWISPDGSERTTLADPWEKDIFQTRSSLTVTKEGNYTCIASNVQGEERITVDTRNLPTSGLKLRVESREIEILETPQGFMVTLFFMALLGYYFRVDSLRDLKKFH